ncbi:MAG: N-6 DNA methylase, partial [Flavobacterium sp.]
GSPLFTGDAGSGESDIRKWIIENDWLDCIVALPKDMFYNTGINTYIWFLTNNKQKHRKGKVQLINAVEYCRSNKKSLGNKRNEITENHISKILDLYNKFEATKDCKIFNNDYFGFYQLVVEQPLYDNKGKKLLDKNKKPKPDSKKRDKENVPLNADIDKYFKNEVLSHIPDAWIDFDKTRIGYEINFTKYFYQYKNLRDASDVKSEIVTLESEITDLLNELLN